MPYMPVSSISLQTSFWISDNHTQTSDNVEQTEPELRFVATAICVPSITIATERRDILAQPWLQSI
jgi:hypothetical protein